MKRNLTLLLLALFPLTLTSCGGGVEVEPTDDFGVTAVQIVSATELFLTRGERSAAEADVLVKDETVDKTLIWISSDNNIATVDENGVITAGQTTGVCTISAISKVGGYADRITVHVGGGSSQEITGLSLSVTSHTFKSINDNPIEIIPTITPSTIAASFVNWTISNEEIASFEKTDKGIKVTPKAVGSATITGKAGQKTANCNIVVENPDDPTPGEKTITLNETSHEMKINSTFTLVATVTGIMDAEPLSFAIGDTTILSENGKNNRTFSVKALKSGDTTITCSYGTGDEKIEKVCNVHVTEEEDDYGAFCAQFSKPGHVYLHYKRLSDTNYDPWAVWMWQKVPEDSEGTLWGATHADDLKKGANITSVTTSWMTGDDVKLGGRDVYSDDNGQIVDIDVSRTDLIGGKTGVATSFKDSQGNYCSRIGFLIVDQTKMTGGSHWKSDGGIEAYVKKFDEYMMKGGKEQYLHIFCIEGQVTQFSTEAGAEVETNPTIADTTGKYRSKSNISDLKRDAHPGQASPTSTSFLNDRPGVGYQIFVPAFADSNGDGLGDLGGIIKKLDENYFKDLGVGVLWLTPVQESGSYHGYDVTNYYEIDPKFGTMAQYEELIQKAHAQGIKVLMDMVINHTSKNNVLFTQSQKAGKVELVKGSGQMVDARDMYLWKFKGDKIREWNGVEVDSNSFPTYSSVAVENSSDWYQDGSSNYYYYGKFGSGMAELNYSYDATRTYMEEMCKWWLAKGLDGFRLDAIKHIYLESELSPEEASKYAADNKVSDASYRDYYDDEKQMDVHAKNDYSYDIDLNVKFWKEFAWAIKSAYPNCFLVGENFDGWNKRIAPFYEAIDSQFDFSTYYHLNEFTPDIIGTVAGEPIDGGYGADSLKATLEFNKQYKRKNSINGAFTSNHDIARMMNHAAGALLGSKIHHAEINASNLNATIKQAKYASALTMLMPGVSWVYYGDEIGLTGNVDDKVTSEDDHGNNIDRWYRQPMKWADSLGAQDEGGTYVTKYTFGGLRITWDKMNQSLANVKAQKVDNNSMLSHFKLLGKAKSDSRYPTYGSIIWSGTIGGAANTFSMEVSDDVRKVHVFINNSGSTATIPENDRMANIISGSSGATTSQVPAYGFVVLTNQSK